MFFQSKNEGQESVEAVRALDLQEEVASLLVEFPKCLFLRFKCPSCVWRELSNGLGLPIPHLLGREGGTPGVRDQQPPL